ncbi:MAG: HlyD family type I secretion periplasmic adaptor subunit [Thiotrichales bacterium]|nr:HlyD family type I secretion periplasmic adaptor subunit [Thiotrichales bacterium]
MSHPVKKSAVVAEQSEVLLAQDDVLTAPAVEEKAPFVSLPLDEAPYRRFGMFVTFGMLGVFLVWAAFAPLKSAIVGSGKIVVESRNKVVQHLDGGIVAEIYVKEGDQVHKGQPLLKLSDVQIKAQLTIVHSQLWEAMASFDRLMAERNGLEVLTFSPAVLALKNEPQMARYMETQQQLFTVRRLAYHSEQSVLNQRVAQTKEQINGLEHVVLSEQNRAKSLTQDVKDWRSLYEQQFADKIRLREMERQLTELEGDMASKQSEIARLRQVATETERQKLLRQQEYLKEISDQMRDVQGKQSEGEARQAALVDQLQRIEIDAPDDGRVVGFDVVNVGAVIDPRRPIMQIVPNEHSFAVLGRIQTMDIDMVSAGQRAEIKFSAFNTNFLPVMYGHVESVGADSLIDEATKQPYYTVRVIPEPEAVAVLEKQGWQLVSGMPADIYIQTRERTLLNYIIKPLEVMISKSLNEDDGVL